jgi:hypothetical protein
MKPMIGAKTTVAKYWAELKIADAVPRSLAGNQAATIRPLAGNDGASAKPTRNRKPKRTYIAATVPTTQTPPCSTVNNDQTKMLQKYTILDPNRSNSQPPGSWRIT